MWPEVKKTIDNNIRTGIRQYYTNPMARNVMDRMQKGLACCGSLSIMDWDSNDYYRLILLIYIYISNVHLEIFRLPAERRKSVRELERCNVNQAEMLLCCLTEPASKKGFCQRTQILDLTTLEVSLKTVINIMYYILKIINVSQHSLFFYLYHCMCTRC